MATSEKVAEPGFPFGRAFEYEQALHSARIEGFEPDAEFTADFEALSAGRMTGDEFRARAAARALRASGDAS